MPSDVRFQEILGQLCNSNHMAATYTDIVRGQLQCLACKFTMIPSHAINANRSLYESEKKDKCKK